MPVRNTVRLPMPETYFHVYNRGVNKRKIFLDNADYLFFLSLLGRHLCRKPQTNKAGMEYPHFRPQLSLNAYCLMPNHYHLLLYQQDDPTALSKLMTSVATAYTMYFNRKYNRRGPLFENRFKASPVLDDSYLQHITRYIHLNPSDYKRWHYSSYAAYAGTAPAPDWLEPDRILDLFDSKQQYLTFVEDYQTMHAELENLKHTLANY